MTYDEMIEKMLGKEMKVIEKLEEYENHFGSSPLLQGESDEEIIAMIDEAIRTNKQIVENAPTGAKV